MLRVLLILLCVLLGVVVLLGVLLLVGRHAQPENLQ